MEVVAAEEELTQEVGVFSAKLKEIYVS